MYVACSWKFEQPLGMKDSASALPSLDNEDDACSTLNKRERLSRLVAGFRWAQYTYILWKSSKLREQNPTGLVNRANENLQRAKFQEFCCRASIESLA